MSSPIFNAFAGGVDGLVGPAPAGLITSEARPIAPGDEVFYLAAVGSPDGQPLPSAQLETVVTKREFGRKVEVSETVGRGLTKRFGKWEIKGAVASRTYTYDKFTKGEKAKALEAALWLGSDRQPVGIWCKLVRLDTAKALGFKTPKFHLGFNRKPGTRSTGREHNAEAPKAVVKALDTVPVVENRDAAEGTVRAENLELDAPRPAAPVAPINAEQGPRIRPMELD